MSAKSGQLQGINQRRGAAAGKGFYCVCLFVCLNPLKYHICKRALFSSWRLCRAISSPYTVVFQCHVCLSYQLKERKKGKYVASGPKIFPRSSAPSS